MLDNIDTLAARVAPADTRWTLRAVDEISETLSVRQDVAEAPQRSRDAGVMVSVTRRGGLGHAASADLSEAGLADAFARAARMADAVAGRMVFVPEELPLADARGRFDGAVSRPARSAPLRERLEALRAEIGRAHV